MQLPGTDTTDDIIAEIRQRAAFIVTYREQQL